MEGKLKLAHLIVIIFVTPQPLETKNLVKRERERGINRESGTAVRGVGVTQELLEDFLNIKSHISLNCFAIFYK